jgi:hypothetical protein
VLLLVMPLLLLVLQGPALRPKLLVLVLGMAAAPVGSTKGRRATTAATPPHTPGRVAAVAPAAASAGRRAAANGPVIPLEQLHTLKLDALF